MRNKVIMLLFASLMSLAMQACSVQITQPNLANTTKATPEQEASAAVTTSPEMTDTDMESVAAADTAESASVAESDIAGTESSTATTESAAEGAPSSNELDPFAEDIFNVDAKSEGVVLQFAGTSPYITLTILNNVSSFNPLSEFSYTADKERNIKNGDTITITASAPTVTLNKYKLSRTSTTIQVEGQDSYINSISEITDSDWNQIMVDVNKFASQFSANGPRRKDRTLVYEGIINQKKQQFYLNETGFTLSNFGYGNAVFSSLALAHDGDLEELVAGGQEFNRLTIELTNTINLTDVLYKQIEKEIRRPLTDEEKAELDHKTGYRAIQLFNVRRNADGKLLYDIQKYGWGSTYTDEDRMLSKAVIDVGTMQTKDMSSWPAADYYKKAAQKKEKAQKNEGHTDVPEDRTLTVTEDTPVNGKE